MIRLESFIEELEKIASIDDVEAPPGVSLNPQISRAWKLGKTSSWTEIGPDTSPNKAWKPKVKTAEPPPPKGWTAKEWDKHLQGKADKSLKFVRDKLAYKLQGKTEVQGIPVAIENRKGSVRKGEDEDGKPWRTKMRWPYGYIKGTKGADGEEVDAYVGPKKDAPNAFIVHQRDKDSGKYDEDKVMLAFPDKAAAKKAFLEHYDSPKFLGPVKAVPIERLKELIASKRRLVKIAAKNEKMSFGRRIRKAGPGIGGLVGAGIGALVGRRHGKLLKGAITGLGTGATLGWTPDMAASAKEAIKGRH